MYQLTYASLISSLILALFFGSASAAASPSSSSGKLLQQNTGTIVIVKDTVPDDPQDFVFNFRDASGTAVGGVVLDDDPSDGSVPRQTSRTFAAGTYTAIEEAVTGWIVTAITCEDPDSGSSGTTTNRTATIDLDAGETVTCTFTNEPDPNVPRGTLVIVKDTLPDDPQDFSFLIPGIDSNLSLDDDPGSATPNQYSAIVAAKTYTATEQDVSGWNLTALTCTDPDNGSTTDLAARRATLDIDAGETVTCTFRNEPASVGTIRVIKDAVPDDPQDFVIQLRDASGAGAGGAVVDDDPGSGTQNQFSLTHEAGTYTAREDAVSGWTLTGLICDDPDNGTSTNLANREAAIDLDANETVVCTFTNTKDGQPPATSTPSNTPTPTATPTAIATQTPTPTDTATPTNTPISTGTGTVVIVKDAQPNDPQDFKFFGGDLQVAPFFLDDDNDPTLSNQIMFTNVPSGIHFVREDQDPIGWDLTDITCDDPSGDSSTSLANREAFIVLDAGETVTCTFTNTNVGGTVMIIKDAQPNDAQDFKFFGGDLQVAPFFLDDDSDPTLSNQITFTNVDPGLHFVREDQDPAGWDLTNIICDDPDNGSFILFNNREAVIEVDANETVTCTFTNTKQGQPTTGTIVIVKDAVPNDAQDFEFFNAVLGQFFLDDDSDPTLPNQRSFTVNAGSYEVGETKPAGWDTTAVTCQDPTNDSNGFPHPGESTAQANIELAAGETVTCTFRNQPVPPGTIVIVKDAQPNDPQDFQFLSAGLGNFTLDDDSDPTLPSQRTFTVEAGLYEVVETKPAGWDTTAVTCQDPTNNSFGSPRPGESTAQATIQLAVGETVTCTFTNTLTATFTPTPTLVFTNTPTATPTFTPTKTGTPTKAGTPTHTPTKTLTPTRTPTATTTPTAIATGTPTSTPTSPPSGPSCDGQAATIYVNSQSRIVGGPNNGQLYQGILNGTSGADVIVGTSGPDEIEGKGGADRICGGGDNDELEGNGGNDRLFGEAGNDELAGGDGADTLTGGLGADKFIGGAGTDTATDFTPAQGDTKTSVENF